MTLLIQVGEGDRIARRAGALAWTGKYSQRHEDESQADKCKKTEHGQLT